jgi:hypothetical protein
LGDLDYVSDCVAISLSIATYPFGRVPAIIVRCWERVLGREAIVHVHGNKTKLATQQSTQQLLVLQTSDAPAAAMIHDVQRPTGLLGCVCPHCDLLAVTHCDLVVLLFFDARHRGVTRCRVLLGDGNEVAESRDVAEHSNVEGLSSHGLEHL